MCLDPPPYLNTDSPLSIHHTTGLPPRNGIPRDQPDLRADQFARHRHPTEIEGAVTLTSSSTEATRSAQDHGAAIREHLHTSKTPPSKNTLTLTRTCGSDTLMAEFSGPGLRCRR